MLNSDRRSYAYVTAVQRKQDRNADMNTESDTDIKKRDPLRDLKAPLRRSSDTLKRPSRPDSVAMIQSSTDDESQKRLPGTKSESDLVGIGSAFSSETSCYNLIRTRHSHLGIRLKVGFNPDRSW